MKALKISQKLWNK